MSFGTLNHPKFDTTVKENANLSVTLVSEGTSLHRWISDCKFVLPELVVPPRNEELEKRCQKLRAQQSHAEYNSMVKGIDKNVDAEPG